MAAAAAADASVMRVRAILSNLSTLDKAALKKLLPKGLKMPDLETARYPSALLTVLPKDQSYSILGCIAETLLQKPVADITTDALIASIRHWYPGVPDSSISAVLKSKTTEPFLHLLRETRTKLEAVIVSPILYDVVLLDDTVEGHPDGINDTQVFEVKLTGMLKQNWVSFLFQVFAYASISPDVKEAYLVLPLQQHVWKCDLAGWKTRDAFRDFLIAKSTKIQGDAVTDMFVGNLLREKYFIGFHAPKHKSLMDTVRAFPDYKKPYQIFLGGPQSTALRIEDGELAATAALIATNNVKLYVHSQYMINLCTLAEGDDWNVNLLMKNLQYAAAIGCKGVVVHVGKSTTKPIPEAVDNMRRNIVRALSAATEACPLLLETPAGQGTETLTDQNEFLDFVTSIKDPRLGVCLDTCHVFACGHKPLDYISRFDTHAGLLKLCHYNDSAVPCGACVDRHAFMGTGHIGMEGMAEIAELCASKRVPMVIE
jgi:deoxyribonuclease-4